MTQDYSELPGHESNEDKGRVLVLQGAGGVGKTRLSAAASHSEDEDDPQEFEDISVRRTQVPLGATIKRPAGRVSRVLLNLAGRRLPQELHDVFVDDEWMPELQFILSSSETRRAARWVRGVSFAAGLIWAARRICREYEPGSADGTH